MDQSKLQLPIATWLARVITRDSVVVLPVLLPGLSPIPPLSSEGVQAGRTFDAGRGRIEEKEVEGGEM